MTFVDPGACCAACMLFAAATLHAHSGAFARPAPHRAGRARPDALLAGVAALHLVPPCAAPGSQGVDRGAATITLRAALADDAAAQRALCALVAPRDLALFGGGSLSADSVGRGADHARGISVVALRGGVQPLAGLARLSVDRDGVAGEFALIVHPSAQRCGVGRALLERVLAECRRRGLVLVRAAALARNTPMLALARACRFQLLPAADGTVELIRALAPRGAGQW